MQKIIPVERTIAELALESISISEVMRQDMVLLQQGKISEQEFLNRAIKRATGDERSFSISRNENVNQSL